MGDSGEMITRDENTPSSETEYLRSLFWVELELENALSELPSQTAGNI